MPADDEEGEVDNDVGTAHELLDGHPVKNVTAQVLGFGQPELAGVERPSPHGHHRAHALGSLEGPEKRAADVARRPGDGYSQPGHAS
jgi:hypothetical protein